MFKFTDTVEEYFKELLNKEEVRICKSNPQSPQCWNENHCEVEIEDEEDGGRLVLKISISEQFGNEISGEIVETWYWDAEDSPEPVVGLFLGAGRKVTVTFPDNNWEGVMKSYYGGYVI